MMQQQCDQARHESDKCSRSLSSTLDRLKLLEIEAAARYERSADECETRRILLPQIDPNKFRAMPNHMARSDLFSPISRRREEVYVRRPLISWSNAKILYWGQRLSEYDADVWMYAMSLASMHPLGEPVCVNRAEFLRSIGTHTGNAEYKQLHRSMLTLCFGMLEITAYKRVRGERRVKYQTEAIHLIDGFIFDSDRKTYTLRINQRWASLYANDEFALVDWGKRLTITKNAKMAKALQRLIATSSDSPQYHRVEWLYQKLAYNSPKRKFVQSLNNALSELMRTEIIIHGEVKWNREGKPYAFVERA